jgi:hypothetical protein
MRGYIFNFQSNQNLTYENYELNIPCYFPNF